MIKKITPVGDSVVFTAMVTELKSQSYAYFSIINSVFLEFLTCATGYFWLESEARFSIISKYSSRYL